MKELTDFQKKYQQSLRFEEIEELEKHSKIITSFKNYCFKLGLDLDDENFKYYRTSGIIATYPNIVSFLNESLVNDKEGLFDFSELNKFYERKIFANGYLYAENFMLMAHPYFRRGFHQINNFAPRFIELYWSFNRPNLDKYISIDCNSVRINVDNSIYREFDTWFGAPFHKDISSLPDGINKLRPPLYLSESHVSLFFSDAYSLDIQWHTKNGIKSFQAEEFKTDEVKIIKDDCEYFPVRYIHAEFDIQKGYFRHFDGAIHFYTAEEYYNRRDSDFNYNSKNLNQIKTLSEKLFKINGIVEIGVWTEFTCHFFTGNPLIHEYFEGEYPKYIIDLLNKVKE